MNALPFYLAGSRRRLAGRGPRAFRRGGRRRRPKDWSGENRPESDGDDPAQLHGCQPLSQPSRAPARRRNRRTGEDAPKGSNRHAAPRLPRGPAVPPAATTLPTMKCEPTPSRTPLTDRAALFTSVNSVLLSVAIKKHQRRPGRDGLALAGKEKPAPGRARVGEGGFGDGSAELCKKTRAGVELARGQTVSQPAHAGRSLGRRPPESVAGSAVPDTPGSRTQAAASPEPTTGPGPLLFQPRLLTLAMPSSRQAGFLIATTVPSDRLSPPIGR